MQSDKRIGNGREHNWDGEKQRQLSDRFAEEVGVYAIQSRLGLT